VFKQGRRSADPLFTVLYRHSDLDYARLGMAASSKRVRTAVGRNRIRRLVRESFRHSTALLAGLDVVVLVKDAAARAPNPDIAASLLAHWARLNQSVAAR
jgi:ribonuclease P protein component